MKKNSTNSKKPAVDLLYRALKGCSISCLFRISALLAFIIAHSNNRMSSQARQNIQLCFPQLDKAAQKRLLNETIHHTSCAFFELASLWYLPTEKVLKLIKSEQVDPPFSKSSRAKIIIAPHHGSWEMLNFWLTDKAPLYALYKPAKSKSLDQFIKEKRTQSNAVLVPINTSGLRKLLKGLKDGVNCIILPDQRPASNTAQIDAPFFGHQAATSLLIKKLASKVKCDIYIAAVTRDLHLAHYNLKAKELDRDSILMNDFDSASYLNASIEEFIQDDLSQYQWPYRRFNKEIYSSINMD